MTEPKAQVVVVARWHAEPAHHGPVLRLVTELRARSLEEPGCLAYEILVSPTDATAIVLLERYRNAAAVEEHRASAHYREILVGEILPLLAERHVEILRPR